MNLLRQPGQKRGQICEDLADLIVKGRMSPVTLKFFTEELFGLKTLQRLDENSQLVLANILEEVTDKIAPAVERTLLLLAEVRGLVRARQLQFGPSSHMCLGLSESIIQKLVDFMEYYFHQVQVLAFDVAEAKVNVRNMLVYFNSLTLKLAVSNPHLSS